MKERFNQTWQFIEAVERAPTAASVERCLLNLAGRLGFTAIFGGIVPFRRLPPAEVSARILFQHFPVEWADRYNSKGYLFRDPIVHRLRSDRMPFGWKDAYTTCSRRSDVTLIQGEASEFGLRHGHVVPISMIDGGLAAVSFGGRCIDSNTEHLSVLNFAASYAVGSYLHHAESRRQHHNGKLTPRESDCLLWASEGKTDWEISVILGISRPTVTKHLLSARQKLNAVNRAHLIGEAIRQKIIR